MAYGIDLFLVRVAPDKAFDMLADGFNYLQLIAIMIAVTFAAIFFKNKAKEAKLRKLHLDWYFVAIIISKITISYKLI